MPDRIRFHLDEHIDRAIAIGLVRAGVDVTTTNEAGLRTTSDPTQFAYSIRERRVFVTGDRGVMGLAAESAAHFGLVFIRRNQLTIGQQIRELLLLHDFYDSDDMIDRIEYFH